MLHHICAAFSWELSAVAWMCCDRIFEACARVVLCACGGSGIGDADPLFSPVAHWQLLLLQGVVAEADDANYWFHASRDGNREKHYR
jgi:hypothetical protein